MELFTFHRELEDNPIHQVGKATLIAIAEQLTGCIPPEYAGKRVDRALADLYPEYSRTAIQKWLRQGLVLLEGEVPSQRDRVVGGEQVEVAVPEARVQTWEPEPIDLDIVFEDAHLIVVNKPAGLIVHPGAGNPSATMLNALLYYDPRLAELPRAGIVHRLDKHTSGLLVVARSEVARRRLIEQLAEHSLQRRYLAVVVGVVISGGTVDEPIGRDPNDRRRMMVSEKGKPAVTHFRVAERYRAHSLLRIRLMTGRTHQIRVHLKHRGFPLVGDPVYGGRLRMPANAEHEFRDALRAFRRQALHAAELALVHPVSGALLRWRQALPRDMSQLIAMLEADRQRHSMTGGP